MASAAPPLPRGYAGFHARHAASCAAPVRLGARVHCRPSAHECHPAACADLHRKACRQALDRQDRPWPWLRLPELPHCRPIAGIALHRLAERRLAAGPQRQAAVRQRGAAPRQRAVGSRWLCGAGGCSAVSGCAGGAGAVWAAVSRAINSSRAALAIPANCALVSSGNFLALENWRAVLKRWSSSSALSSLSGR